MAEAESLGVVLGGPDEPVDEALPELTQADFVKIIEECKREAADARRGRDELTKRNWDAYLGEQDWSEKTDSQSAEFLPKVPMAVEQIAAFVRRGLVAFGDWFKVEVQPSARIVGTPLTDEAIVKLIRSRLENPSEDLPGLAFPTVLSDAVKVGLLGALVILKVHGFTQVERRLKVGVDEGNQEALVVEEVPVWHLAIDLVRPQDYYPDPTGRGLYEIHRTERDLYEIVELAEQGLYDAVEVAKIQSDFTDQERQYKLAKETGQLEAHAPGFRKRVVLDEFWGTLLDREGQVVAKNVVVTVANEKYVIRGPEDNPFWHQQSPFVAAPLVRVPFSQWHKAIFDHATDLNLALNELFNLMLDGAIGAVWGTRQVKLSAIENAKQFSDGIPQGATLLVKEEVPAGEKVMEIVATGQIPPDALAMYHVLDREVQFATLTPELKMGMLPQRQVKATEIVEASNQSAVFFDGLIFDLENHVIRPALHKAWLTMLQHVDDWRTDEVVGVLGPNAAAQLAMMSPAARYAAFAQGHRFKVFGLSSVLARVKEFQKMMALFQVVGTNALLLQAFVQRFNPDKALDHIFKSLNIDPTNLELTEEEQAGLQERMQQLPLFQELIRGGGQNRGVGGGDGSGMSAQTVGETGLPAEVNQMSNPLTGMVG